ncbi:MAG: methyltransferase domain-containing protein [Rhizobiales bacterium]|nr:methyltransferase domain-containing protein [Hyphomicrobiales bacterium]
MGQAENGELYHDRMIGILERLWGDGWLSPGGPDEVRRLLDGMDLAGKSILDIGCGAGGIDVLLVKEFGAGYVCGIDVEDTVLANARARAEKAGCAGSIGVVKVVPGPLPFPPGTFDIVFSKDSIVHIPAKHTLMQDVFRVLKPGGWFVASDWLIGHDDEPSRQMKNYIASEGLDFGMASPGRYRDAMEKAGFTDITVTSRNAWYRERARQELETLSGPLYGEAVQALGQEFVDHNVTIWRNMIPVLDSGEHCPTHLRGFKPLA